MQMPNSYTYRFFYKIGFYMLSLLCAGLCVAWIATSISRDNKYDEAIFWRKLFIREAVLLNINTRERDILADILTAQESGVCEIYCDQIREFKLNHARRHGNEN